MGKGSDNSATAPIEVWHEKRVRCNDPSPASGTYTCDLQKGHNGPHIFYDMGGTEIIRWDVIHGTAVTRHTPRSAPKADPEMLAWAKGLNPKRFKSSGEGKTAALADNCKGTLRHSDCTEPWCECTCHDKDKDDATLRAMRMPWSVCLGVIALALGLLQ